MFTQFIDCQWPTGLAPGGYSNKSSYPTDLPLAATTTNLSTQQICPDGCNNKSIYIYSTNQPLVAATTNLSTQQICPGGCNNKYIYPTDLPQVATTTNLSPQQICPGWLQQQIYLPNRFAPGGYNKPISPTDLPLVATTTNLSPQQICPGWLQQQIWPHLPNRLAPGGYNKTSDPIYPTDWPLVAITHQTHLLIGLASGSSALNLIQSSKWTHPWSAYRMRGEPEDARRGPPPSPPWWNLWLSADHCSAGLQSPHWNQASTTAEIN